MFYSGKVSVGSDKATTVLGLELSSSLGFFGFKGKVMDEDEKIEMRWNQHRTKPSFGIMREGKQTKGLHRAKGVTEGSRPWTNGRTGMEG